LPWGTLVGIFALMISLPSQAYLHECFSYDPETGRLMWKPRPLHHFKQQHDQTAWNNKNAGNTAGSRGGNYLFVSVGGCHVLVHRVVWAMRTGTWPERVDHLNRDGLDNRWENLREATQQQNLWNRKLPIRDLPRGVRRSPRGGKFIARATINYEEIHLGSFDTPEKAHAAWRAFVERERGEFFRAD